MARRILRSNRDSVLSANNRDLGQNSIPDGTFNLYNLLVRFLVCQTVQEQINIRRWTELLVVVLAQLALGRVELGRDRQKTVDDRGPRGNHIIPVHVGKGRLGKDAEVALELLDRLHDRRGSVGEALVRGERHDVAAALRLGLDLEVAGPGSNELGVV